MSEWQPIETAPKDGSDILIGGAGHTTHEARWFRPEQTRNQPGFYWSSYHGEPVGPIFPTHWMPLPERPRE